MAELGSAAGPVLGALVEELGETVEPPEEPEDWEPVEPEEEEPELPEDMPLSDEPEPLFIPMLLHAARTKAHAKGIVHFNIRFS